MTRESTARYLSTPRQCTDCGGVPAAGRLRCDTCHKQYIQNQDEGRTACENSMQDVDEQRIREIVREELAAAKAESTVLASAEMAVMQASARGLIDGLLNDDNLPRLPDREREAIEGYFNRLLGGD